MTSVLGPVKTSVGPESLLLDGAQNYVRLAVSMDTATLPPTNLTAEAWVALRAPTASSHDTRVRGNGLKGQWFGEPAARGFTDRQGRRPPPLTVNGFFYAQGNDRVYALDGYNGKIYWELEIPNLRRVNIPRDGSNMCADQTSDQTSVILE